MKVVLAPRGRINSGKVAPLDAESSVAVWALAWPEAGVLD